MPRVSISDIEDEFDLQQASLHDERPDSRPKRTATLFWKSNLKPFKGKILELREGGMSYASIAKWLSENGCQITGQSVGAFIKANGLQVTGQRAGASVKSQPIPHNPPSDGLGKTLFDKYGPAMTLKQLADTLHRSQEGLRIALMTKKPKQPFDAALIAARYKVGRWVRFRTNDVADLIAGQAGLSAQVGDDLAAPSPVGSIGEVLFAKYGPLMTLHQLADTLHRSPEGLRISLVQSPNTPFNKALNEARFKLNRGHRFRTAEICLILESGVNAATGSPKNKVKTPAGNHNWKPEEDALLESNSFKSVAGRLGLQISEVASRALALGLQPFGASSPIDKESFEDWIWDRFQAEQTGADWSDAPPDLPQYI